MTTSGVVKSMEYAQQMSDMSEIIPFVFLYVSVSISI